MTRSLAGARPPLSEAVHVWYVFADSADWWARRSACYELLCEDERVRYARFVFDRDRQAFLLAHALVRMTLSRYAAVSPERWRFRTEHGGRPEILEPTTLPRLRFNLSHTPGLVACAITEERDVGIDVESVRNGPIVDRVSDRHFSSSEIETLARVSSAARAQTFFDYWTLKEAYIKARGMGFGIPLDKFSFHLSDAAAPKISFVSGFPDDASCWQFALYPLGPRHRLAVAVQRDPSTEIRFELTAATPAPGVMRTPIGTCAATGSAGQNPDGRPRARLINS